MHMYYKSVSGKISMISLDTHGKDQAIFTVKGETNNYTVSITTTPGCTCEVKKHKRYFCTSNV